MVLEEMNAVYNPWSMLQQPAHASKGMSSSFRSLLAAIDQGWQVIKPVRAVSTAQAETCWYEIWLWHPTQSLTSRLMSPASWDVQRFLERNHIPVVEG